MAWTMLRSERSLELIEKAQEKTSSLVIRDGETLKVNQNDIVVGDLLVIEPEKKVRADGILIKADKLRVDESIFLREILENNKRSDEFMKEFWKDEKVQPSTTA
jgi:Ca2+-transporting ATPase